MSSARTLIARVQRLEQARVAPRSPIEKWWGSLEAFEAETREAVNAHVLDRTDLYGVDGRGGIMHAIRGWHVRGLFAQR